MVKELDRKAKIEALKVKNNRKLVVKYLEERLIWVNKQITKYTSF